MLPQKPMANRFGMKTAKHLKSLYIVSTTQAKSGPEQTSFFLSLSTCKKTIQTRSRTCCGNVSFCFNLFSFSALCFPALCVTSRGVLDSLQTRGADVSKHGKLLRPLLAARPLSCEAISDVLSFA